MHILLISVNQHCHTYLNDTIVCNCLPGFFRHRNNQCACRCNILYIIMCYTELDYVVINFNVIDYIVPLVVHQPASLSIWPAVQSLRRGMSTNPDHITLNTDTPTTECQTPHYNKHVLQISPWCHTIQPDIVDSSTRTTYPSSSQSTYDITIDCN